MSTMRHARPTLAALKARLEDLKNELQGRILSDGYAYSNGTVDRMNTQIADVQREIDSRNSAQLAINSASSAALSG